MPQQPLSASGQSVSAVASPTTVTAVARALSPKSSSRRVQRKGSPSPLQKGKKKKKKLNASPRDGKVKADRRGDLSDSGTAAVVAEAAERLDHEQPAEADGSAVGTPSVSLLGLAEEKRSAEIRAAKEAKELAEEEECRRQWYDCVYIQTQRCAETRCGKG